MRLNTKVPRIGPLAAVFLAGLEVGQVLLPLHRLLPDPVVEAAHDGDRDVEGRDGRPEGDVVVGLDELDVAGLLGNCSLPFDVGPRVYPRRP